MDSSIYLVENGNTFKWIEKYVRQYTEKFNILDSIRYLAEVEEGFVRLGTGALEDSKDKLFLLRQFEHKPKLKLLYYTFPHLDNVVYNNKGDVGLCQIYMNLYSLPENYQAILFDKCFQQLAKVWLKSVKKGYLGSTLMFRGIDAELLKKAAYIG